MSEAAAVEDLQRKVLQRRKEPGLPEHRPRPVRRPAPATAAPSTVQVSSSTVELRCQRCENEFAFTRILSGGKPVAPDPQLCGACSQAEASRSSPAPEDSGPDVRDQIAAAGGNPWKFGQSCFGSFRPLDGRGTATAAAREWAEQVLLRLDRYDQVRGLLLWGETGLAKTELLHCVLRRLLEGGLQPRRGVLYADWRAFVHEVQGTYGRDSAWAVISRCIRADVLLLDDLFAGKVRADVVDIAFTILNQREGRPTVITTNLDPDTIDEQLLAAVGPAVEYDAARIRSRLGAYRVVQVQGEEDGRLLRT